MPTNKLTLNLTTNEVTALIKQDIQREFPEFTVKKVSYKMSEAGYSRNEAYGHSFNGVDVEIEKAYLVGRDNI